MSLRAGTTLGSYAITAQIGEGGMGEVYRARDTKLDRDVAIKVLPESLAADPERIARFEREAKTLAALNHPNIAQIHGLEESDGMRGLVMELVEGPTLADRIAQGPIPLDEALPIARQMAEALEAAHEQGIIHRDLKPANVKVRPDGMVKVLDFGLAKALEPPSPISAGVSQSPTITTPARTIQGVILGTAAYMSPEQARGKPIDRRADIWAFGCVVFEMLTGRRAFVGDDVSDTLASVIRSEPTWESLPSDVPPAVRTSLRRCLEKDPRQRMRDIGDVRLAMDGAFDILVAASTESPASLQRAARLREVFVGVAALIAGTVIVGVLYRGDPAPPSPVRFTILAAGELPRGVGPMLSLSRDGTTLVYSAVIEGERHLYRRASDQFEAVPIPGGEGGRMPFLSPDGQWIGFSIEGVLKKIPTAGGPPMTLCDCGAGRSATWGPDDLIIFTDASGRLSTVSATGGVPHPVTTLEEDEVVHRGVSVLPDGRGILFAALSGGRETARIVAQSLDTGERRMLLDGTHPRYAPTGHLLFTLGDALWAVPFDVDRLEVKGNPIPVIERVRQEPLGAAQYEFAQDGTLVYMPSLPDAMRQDALLWVNRDNGEVTPLTGDARLFERLSVSPDGEEIALQIDGEDGDKIWILDIERGTLVPQTFGSALNRDPVWAPDGMRVAFSAGGELAWIALDASGEFEHFLRQEGIQAPSSWSFDGSVIAFENTAPETGTDIWTFSVRDGTASPFLETRATESDVVFSPDAEWVAYVSDESGREEVYLLPYPGPGRRTVVSTAGGQRPRWSVDGAELFYRTDSGEVMVVPILDASSMRVGRPEALFRLTGLVDYDIHPDGTRFVVIRSLSPEAALINVVKNWFEELQRLVPVN